MTKLSEPVRSRARAALWHRLRAVVTSGMRLDEAERGAEFRGVSKGGWQVKAYPVPRPRQPHQANATPSTARRDRRTPCRPNPREAPHEPQWLCFLQEAICSSAALACKDASAYQPPHTPRLPSTHHSFPTSLSRLLPPVLPARRMAYAVDAAAARVFSCGRGVAMGVLVLVSGWDCGWSGGVTTRKG